MPTQDTVRPSAAPRPPRKSSSRRVTERLIQSIQTGQMLGYYHVLAARGPLTPEEIAQRTGAHASAVRYWLEQQVSAELVQVVPGDGAPARYRIAPGCEAALVGPVRSEKFLRRLW